MFNINLSSTSNQVTSEKLYDILIIGSGPAGLSAALYAKRKGLEVGVIGDHPGGQVNDTSSVENYIGFDFITGQDLARNFEKHVNKLDVDFENSARIKSIKKHEYFELQADNFMTYRSKTVIIATGSKSRHLGVQGEEAFYGKGVSYCAICDGPLFKDKVVTVVGGGNSAVEAAIDLSKIAKKVHIVHRSQYRADQILVDKLKQIENIEEFLQTQVKSIHGGDQVTYIELEGHNTMKLDTDGVLIEIGYVPNSQFADVEKNSRGEIIVDDHQKTSVEGIFAAGDVTTVSYKQIVIAAGEGAKAALAANDYLNNL